MPKVSIVIPSWFEEGQHGRHGQNEVFHVADICLTRLKETLAHRNDVEIHIIDNGSTLAGTEEYFSKADVLTRNAVNRGFAPAMNTGIDHATGEYIIAMNNDILVYGNDWLDKLLLGFEQDLIPPVGLLMPNLLKKEFQKDCVTDGKMDFAKLVKLRPEDIILRNENIYEPKAEFGSMFIFTKKLRDEVRALNNGYEFYDERFLHGYGEDRWLYEQVRKLGYETYRTNRIRVAHVGGLSMSKIKNKEGVREALDANRELLKKLKEE